MRTFILKISKTENSDAGRKRSFGIRNFLLLCLLLLSWQGLSLLYSPLVLPSPIFTLETLVEIIRSERFFTEVYTTLERLVLGLLISVVIGSVLGVAMGASKKVRGLFEPLVYLVQATPPILYMTLAMLWFGLNGRSTIFIVVMGSAPVMAVNITEGFENIDEKLIEMGKAFNFPRLKMITQIIIPSLKAYFKTGLITVFSFGWKLVVMGEVLSASTGLGAQITDARMNLETNKVFAWGIIIILLCFTFQKVTARLFGIKLKRRKNYAD